MRARDQSSIFSTGGKFRPDYGLLLELHALTLVARSYALLVEVDLLLLQRKWQLPHLFRGGVVTSRIMRSLSNPLHATVV